MWSKFKATLSSTRGLYYKTSSDMSPNKSPINSGWAVKQNTNRVIVKDTNVFVVLASWY